MLCLAPKLKPRTLATVCSSRTQCSRAVNRPNVLCCQILLALLYLVAHSVGEDSILLSPPPPPRSNQECAPPPKSSSPPSWWWRRHNGTCCNIHNLGIWTRLLGTKHKIRQLQSNCLNQLHVITQLIRGGCFYLLHFDMCRTIKTTVGAKPCFCLTEMVVREWRAGAGGRCMAEVSTAS